jgi:hypothetical protein
VNAAARHENVKVTAALVKHPPVVPVFAYRFDARDRSIVISGDTGRSDNVVQLVRVVDALMHSAIRTCDRPRYRTGVECGGSDAKHPYTPDVGGRGEARGTRSRRQDARRRRLLRRAGDPLTRHGADSPHLRNRNDAQRGPSPRAGLPPSFLECARTSCVGHCEIGRFSKRVFAKATV